jgi:hypothetical protein
MAEKQLIFRPKLEGDFKNRFYKAVSTIDANTPTEVVLSIADSEINWVENTCKVNLEQRKKYRAVWYLFRDLISASYRAEFVDGSLVMNLPTVSSKTLQTSTNSEVKKMLRSWMAESRHERIVSGKEFVTRMEKGSSTKRPVTDLIADGALLAQKLEEVKKGTLRINEAIDPHLELVENTRDEGYTNQSLPDIWQYFRLTWSSAYENTPGRTLRYLIRDYAHPMHAVMGIASLENCTVQITDRDTALGWTPTALSERLVKLSAADRRKEFEKLLSYLEDGIKSIDYSKIVSEDVIRNPKVEVIVSLERKARELDIKRKQTLKTGSSEDEEKSDLGKISKKSEDELYKKKRTEQIAKFLGAKRIISDFLENGDIEHGCQDFCSSDNGSSAINTALVAQKSKHIGSSMMELNVCGAIPPYNEILGGKLVALLATSPQVIHDYKERYKDRPSEIASRMKGEPVIRPADLVYVGTTSLYYVGSSQYNRLKIPGELFNSDYDVRWKKLGMTMGFGTMHISRMTTECLNEAVGDDSKLINHVFGEGASPKFRLLTMGISKLLEASSGNDPKDFSKHAMPRIVYGACLAKNTSRYLLGLDSKPEYYTDINNYQTGTQKVIDYWRDRWVMSRLNYSPVFDRLKAFDKNSLLVSNEFRDDETINFVPLKEEVSMPKTGKDEKLDFVRGFYRGTSAFADNISEDLLELIHVKTDLDDSIIKNVSDGKDVVLTGNAGDGKTHIIKILENKLKETGKDPIFMLDASEKTEEETYKNWKAARESGRPFVLAINAAILYALNEYCKKNDPDFQPVTEAFELMQGSIGFHGNTLHYDDLVVYDLSKRNVLDSKFVKDAVLRLSKGDLYEKCESCPVKKSCSAQRNRKYLTDKIFIERFSFILTRISLQGYHATLRDLQSLIAYLIFGDKSCTLLAAAAGGDGSKITDLLYDTNARGNIFRAIRDSFDPIHVSHPVYDELILSNKIPQDTWSKGYPAPFNSIEPNDLEAFNKRKREFFFFNKNGAEYIKVNDDIASRFEDFLKENDKNMRKQIVRKLDCFFQTEPSNDLQIWSGHRYSNEPRKILFSIGSLSDSKFQIGRPTLQKDMAQGFSIVSNYVRFERKISDKENIYLKIDYGMFELLTQAENGVPVFFMDSDLVKKVWRFVEQLQSMKNLSGEERIWYTIQDVETNERVHIEVDREDKQYLKVEVEHRKD